MIIASQIEKTFKEELSSLNAICFVEKPYCAAQKYILTSILDLFGEDVKENIIAMLTFCDGRIPNMVKVLEDPKCVFSTFIPHINKPWF